MGKGARPEVSGPSGRASSPWAVGQEVGIRWPKGAAFTFAGPALSLSPVPSHRTHSLLLQAVISTWECAQV